MTSHLNDIQIKNFFEFNNYFGYNKSLIYFFKQELKPCLSLDGKLIVENKNCISQAPDGNGGLYIALERSGALTDMKSRGIEHLHVYGVDNVSFLNTGHITNTSFMFKNCSSLRSINGFDFVAQVSICF